MASPGPLPAGSTGHVPLVILHKERHGPVRAPHPPLHFLVLAPRLDQLLETSLLLGISIPMGATGFPLPRREADPAPSLPFTWRPTAESPAPL